MSKIENDKIQKMIDLYHHGLSQIDIAKQLEVSPDTVRKYLKQQGLFFTKFSDRLSNEEKQLLIDLYSKGDWDNIFKTFPFLTKDRVYHIMGSLGVKKESYFWTKEEENFLVNNYHNYSSSELYQIFMGRHSNKAIVSKAIKLGLTESQKWSNKEIEILKTYYSKQPIDKVMNKLSNRSYDSIVSKAGNLGLESYFYLFQKYTELDKKYIKNNFLVKTDFEIAKVLNKPLSGVQEQRRKMGLYYLNKNYSGYENISKFFRGLLNEWKNKSMEKCNYQCILTGSKDYEIHHLYSFNKIVEETLAECEHQHIPLVNDLSQYDAETMEKIKNIFVQIHNQYPLGVCVDRQIHILFHQLYGSGGNTISQWEQFVQDYKLGKYLNLA